ncbi:MAG: RluA family pseudouridine synthase [Oscillibacter sp.]|nr:RluA family pseudouridine synthase [Oscillibacter sp.]
MERITRTITPDEDGLTVRRYLRGKLRFSARAVSRLTRAETGILVNGERAFTVRVLHAGDCLQVETGDHRGPKKPLIPGNWPLSILWEDEHFLILDKPAGMTSHASNFDPDAPNVGGALAYLRGDGFVFHPVNRLDRGTSGLMVVAKSGYIHDRFRWMLHSRVFQREYRAICTGRPEPPRGVADLPIGRDERSVVARMVRPDGARAVTEYETLTHNAGAALSMVRLCPRTGRTHQLRVHMAHMGCALLGDWLYGAETPLIARPALHSYRLELCHPVTEERLCVTAPLPEDMRRLAETYFRTGEGNHVDMAGDVSL